MIIHHLIKINRPHCLNLLSIPEIQALLQPSEPNFVLFEATEGTAVTQLFHTIMVWHCVVPYVRVYCRLTSF